MPIPLFLRIKIYVNIERAWMRGRWATHLGCKYFHTLSASEGNMSAFLWVDIFQTRYDFGNNGSHISAYQVQCHKVISQFQHYFKAHLCGKKTQIIATTCKKMFCSYGKNHSHHPKITRRAVAVHSNNCAS